MNCHDVDHALIEGGTAVIAKLSAEAQKHIAGCERCQGLVGALNAPASTDTPSPEMLQNLARKLAAGLRPVRPLAPMRYFLCAFAGIFGLIVALGVYRMGPFAISVMSPVQGVTILCALAASAGLLAYSLVHQMVPGSRQPLNPELLPAAIMIMLLLVTAVLFQFQYHANFWGNSWGCFRAGAPFALIAILPIWLLLRRGAVLTPRSTGAAAGLLAGLVGASVLEIHCPNLDVSHILIGHLGVAVAGAVVGLSIGFAGEMIGRRSYSTNSSK